MISLFDFTKLIAPVKRKIFSLIGRAILTAIDNTQKVQLLQLDGLSKEVLSDVERPQNYGLETYPKADMEAVVGFINGNRDQGLVLIVADKENRPTDLVEGEVQLYNVDAQKITLKSDQIKIEGTAINLLGAAKSYVLGEDLKTHLDNLKTAYDAHTHAGVTAGAAISGPPSAPSPVIGTILSTKIKGE